LSTAGAKTLPGSLQYFNDVALLIAYADCARRDTFAPQIPRALVLQYIVRMRCLFWHRLLYSRLASADFFHSMMPDVGPTTARLMATLSALQ
jgi:hypothetical protein